MQITKKDGNKYVKELDKIDLYLLNMMKRFFNADTEGIKECAEAIILEAVKRAKDEIFIKGKYGVQSINTKTGVVTLSASDVGAEPTIVIKHNAFNKSFGSKADTVCEGNDPRLSDAREPLPHEHPEYVKASDLHLEPATESEEGLMSADDKKKLDGIEEGANKYTHPTDPGNKHIPAGGADKQILSWASDGTAKWTDFDLTSLIGVVTHTKNGIMTAADKMKLDAIDDEANKYIHPLTHPATMISGDATHRFVTDAEIEYWNSKIDIDDAYVHPTTTGWKHIPAGGATGNFLKWASDGTAQWADVSLDIVTTTKNGIMSYQDKVKLDGIEAGANKYTHPTTSGNKHIPSGGKVNQFLGWKADGEAEWEDKPTGMEGQVYFIAEDSSTDIKLDYTMTKAYIIQTNDELIMSKDRAVDYAAIFQKWYRFSHYEGVVEPYNNGSELGAWQYTTKIECTQNTDSYVGFVSPNKYGNYTLEATLSSTNSDDDTISVVMAFAKDAGGREHTLSAVRVQSMGQSQNMVGTEFHQWALVYDFGKSTSQLLATKMIIGDNTPGWSYTAGTRVRVIRSGNVFKAYASPFSLAAAGLQPIDETSELVFDLNAQTDPIFDIFKGSSQYGYGCRSQNASSFTDVTFGGGTDGYIYDVVNNQTWYYSGGTWILAPDHTVLTDIGKGRFVFNEQTKKLFYITDMGDVVLVNNYSENATVTGIPSGGSSGEVLGWKADGEAQWIDLDTDKTTFESRRIKKRGICTIPFILGTVRMETPIDISTINFYGSPTYNAYYIREDGTKEQIPTMIHDDNFNITESFTAYIDTKTFTISITRKDYTVEKIYKIYFEILDVDASLTIPKARTVNVLNIYPDGVAANYTFTNWKGENFTLSQAAQCKMWLEKPNDESPKGYGQGLINVDPVDMASFSANPDSYLKDASGNYKYDVIYLGAWDSNNGKVLSSTAITAIRNAIIANIGFIAGHDTNSSVSSLKDLMGMDYRVAAGTSTYMSMQLKEVKKGITSSFPWDLGELNTILDIPNCHTSSQFHKGDVWFQFVSASADITTYNGATGHSNFYLGTYNKTAFIQTGHSNGAATPDEQKILANVLYYLANK